MQHDTDNDNDGSVVLALNALTGYGATPMNNMAGGDVIPLGRIVSKDTGYDARMDRAVQRRSLGDQALVNEIEAKRAAAPHKPLFRSKAQRPKNWS